jgi:hypothetical protein
VLPQGDFRAWLQGLDTYSDAEYGLEGEESVEYLDETNTNFKIHSNHSCLGYGSGSFYQWQDKESL